MTDINITPGTGKTVSTETISGSEYQRIKIIDGAVGSSSVLSLVNNGLHVPVSIMGIPNVNIQGNGSVISVWQSASIAGTYSEDSAHTTTDRGVFVLGVRNDNMSSITSADGDYSPKIVGPVGEQIVANAPITKWVNGTTSVMYGASVQVLAAPGSSIFTYITGIQVVNESGNLSRVTISQGLGRVPASMIAWAIAPANGGSNMTFPNPIRVLDNNGVSASISGVSSVYVMIQGFNSKV